jgi:hypothetical protein
MSWHFLQGQEEVSWREPSLAGRKRYILFSLHGIIIPCKQNIVLSVKKTS